MFQKHPASMMVGRIAAALALVAGGVGLALLLQPWTFQSAAVLVLGSVGLAAWVGGLVPGLIAALAATVALERWIYTPYDLSFTIGDMLRLLITCGVAVMVAMISRRQHTAVLATEQARRHLDLLTDSLPVLIGYIDTDQRYQFNNKAYAEWFGRPKQSLRGLTVRELVGEEAYAQIRAPLESALAGNVVSFEQAIAYEPDTTRVVLATLVPEVNDAGEVLGVAVMVADVSERRRAEAALRASEEKFHVMADSAPVMVWIADENKQYTWVNQPWLDFTGRELEAELGFGWMQSVHPEDQPLCRETFEQSIETRAEFAIEYRMRRRDGEWRWLLDNGRPLMDTDGHFAGYVGSCIDITDRKEHEEEREHLLASERHARGEAERVSKLKDDFLATLSHELRTPLNAILGWAQLLRTSPHNAEEVSQGLEVIERNARSQTQIISDLLDMSRIMSGKVELQIEETDLQMVLHSAVQTVQHSADAKGVRLERRIDPAVGVISADTGRLQQVLWNLLSNAIKFTPRNGVVAVQLRGGPHHAEIEVRDTGQGIAPDFLPHVFERFRQADASSTRKHGGLGLGLSIAKSIIEMHGGLIRAESEGLGHGSCFTITLPLTIPATLRHQASPPPPWQASTNKVYPPKLNGIKVLAIDDEADSRDLMKRLLCEQGAEVVTACDADEAMALLTRRPFDVLLSDIGMPERDGYDLIRELRAAHSSRNARIPAAAVTAFARSEDRTRALLSGYQSFVAKPFDPSELIAVVASLSESFSRENHAAEAGAVIPERGVGD